MSVVVSSRLSTRAGRFARVAQAIAGGGGMPEGAAHVAKEFLDTPEVAHYFKSGEPAALGTSTEGWSSAAPGAVEFATLLAPRTVLGRLGSGDVPNVRRVPFFIAVAAQVDVAAFYWVGEGKPIPVPGLDFSTVRLPPLKMAGIVPLTRELIEARGPAAEQAVTDSLLAAAALFSDAAFLDPGVSEVADISPASITNGITPIPSAGDPASDVLAMVTATKLDLSDGVLLMAPTTAVAIAAQMLGAANALGVRGGTLFGLPVLTSPALADNLALIHTSTIAVAEDSTFAIDASDQATIEMSSPPSQDGTTGSGAQLVSMFQTNTRAVRLMKSANWQRTHDSSVILVSGVEYGAES